ncbi:MAG: nitronate monooxygenase [Crocinitomicaceae bacterium]|nr:nitronate monooxygenase [Crocinitomicaceae bacterium]|tara:strand:- start:1587 stop:2540 length:954 start_codon:yes stop_codon:yes gene_type:complete
MKNRVTTLFDIQYPIIQAGMIWCSPWQLAAAVSNAGGLGIIGSGSMYPEVLKEHVEKCKKATDKPFAVNIPLLYPNIEEHVKTIIDYKVPVVFSSAGNPKTWTGELKKHGIKVVHVVSSAKFAQKAAAAGVDAVVAEGFEAGGHNGREETTTLCLIPLVADAVDIPVIAAGGIGSGRAMAAAMALGAEGVQIGSRFAASEESSAHLNFKNKIVATQEGDTVLTLKELAPVRLIKNKFYEEVAAAYQRGAEKEELISILGRARSKKGMFEGDMDEGELEIGQVAAMINNVKPAAEIFNEILAEYRQVRANLLASNYDF